MKELPVNWSEIEKACLAGVPMLDVAKGVADKTPELGPDATKRLYTAIRKRSSRERWALPDSIVRRAQAQARVAAGVAKDAKEGARWQAGVDNLDQVQQSRNVAGMGVPQRIVDGISGELSPAKNAMISCEVANAGGIARDCAGGALPTAPPTAAELVTADLAALGSRGLRAILSRATQAAEAMQAAPEIRSWNDVQVMTKVISQAAGLDKPSQAVSIVFDRGANASITAWECVDSV